MKKAHKPFSFNNKFLISVLTIIIGILACSVVIWISGYDPVQGIFCLFQGGLKNFTRVCDTVAYATPMILTGLSFAFAYRTGIFNIGMAGQMLFGGCCALIFSLTFPALPRPLMLAGVLAVSLLAGALWGAIPGIMKVKFNVSEVVTTIMMNWIAYWFVYYTVLLDYKSKNIDTESLTIPQSASMKVPALTEATGNSNLNLGIIVALIAVAIITFILAKTVMGYEMKAVGYNRYAAENAGIRVGRRMLQAMAIAGALSGLGGATFYLGYTSRIVIGAMPSAGWNGIAVSLLAGNSTLGLVLSALFLGVMYTGKGFMTAMTGIPSEVSDILISIIIYFSATSALIGNNLESLAKLFTRQKERRKEKDVEHH